MSTSYQWLAEFAQFGGTVYCLLIFLAAIAYALWPANRAKFEDAARMPLRED